MTRLDIKNGAHSARRSNMLFSEAPFGSGIPVFPENALGGRGGNSVYRAVVFLKGVMASEKSACTTNIPVGFAAVFFAALSHFLTPCLLWACVTAKYLPFFSCLYTVIIRCRNFPSAPPLFRLGFDHPAPSRAGLLFPSVRREYPVQG